MNTVNTLISNVNSLVPHYQLGSSLLASLFLGLRSLPVESNNVNIFSEVEQIDCKALKETVKFTQFNETFFVLPIK